jgi:hypothetical protein
MAQDRTPDVSEHALFEAVYRYVAAVYGPAFQPEYLVIRLRGGEKIGLPIPAAWWRPGQDRRTE